jgi:hypothetical protein
MKLNYLMLDKANKYKCVMDGINNGEYALKINTELNCVISTPFYDNDIKYLEYCLFDKEIINE